jgi:hypothetical protein
MTGFFETEDDYRKSWQDFCQQIPERPDGKKVYCLSIVGIKLYNDQNKIYYNGFSKLNPDIEKDEDELEDGFDLETTQENTPQEMADIIANSWRNLDVSEMRYILADDFEYTSQWVLETMYGADAYLEYLQSKFNNLSDSTKPTVAGIRCDESAIEIELEQVVDGSKNRVMLQLEIKDGEVSKGCMCHPSFRRIE